MSPEALSPQTTQISIPKGVADVADLYPPCGDLTGDPMLLVSGVSESDMPVWSGGEGVPDRLRAPDGSILMTLLWPRSVFLGGESREEVLVDGFRVLWLLCREGGRWVEGGRSGGRLEGGGTLRKALDSSWSSFSLACHSSSLAKLKHKRDSVKNSFRIRWVKHGGLVKILLK